MNEFTRTIINGLKTYIQKSRGNWNQNDETAVDYVRNRTHWSEVGLVEILPEITIYIEEDYDKISNDIILELGKTYNVTFNGKEYNCTAWSNDEAILIGNGSIYGGEDVASGNIGGNNEPFSCDSHEDGKLYLNVSESGTHTVRISYQGEVIHKIDKKYLPEISSIKNVLDGSAEGSVRTIETNTEIGEYAFAEGYFTTASGPFSHAEGNLTTASGPFSHAEGFYTTASGGSSHVEGNNTTASGPFSHAEGFNTTASGDSSHAEGYCTIASSQYQHVQGRYNIEDKIDTYVHIVGNGTANDARSNAHTLDWEGNAWFAGDVYIGGTDQNNSDKLVTEKKVETLITSPKDYFVLTDIDNGYTYIVQMKNGNLVSRCGVSSIKVTAMPNKIEYYSGEYFDPTGMVVTATCEDGSIIEITNYTCSDNQFVIGANTVTISYNEAGNTYTTTITVNAIEFDASTILIDFEYTDNGDGTYTLTNWKQTLNGEPSTKMVIPNYGIIRL